MLESNMPNRAKLPVLTLLLVTGCFLTFLFPQIAHCMVYERDDILAGEWWRLVTGIGVHFSWSHLMYNSGVLLLAGSLMERYHRSCFVALVLITSLASGLYFLYFLPDMKSFAGLSGVVSAVVVYLCILNIRQQPAVRWLWIVILILFAAKVLYESLLQQAVFVSYSSIIIQVIPSAHIIGAMVAIVFAGRVFVKNRTEKPGSEPSFF